MVRSAAPGELSEVQRGSARYGVFDRVNRFRCLHAVWAALRLLTAVDGDNGCHP
jgi:hypothetical protein